MSDDEENQEETREVQVMGKDAYAAKRQQLYLDYAPYVPQKKIIETATEIYLCVMTDMTLKRGRRRAMMAKCAYEAYKKHNIFKDPIFLCKTFEVDKKKFMSGQDLFYQRLYEMGKMTDFPKVQLTAKQLLPDIASQFKIDDIPSSELGSIIDAMYDSTMFLSRWAPRDVAIVVLFWYASNVEGLEHRINKQDLKKETGIAETKITLMMDTIKKILTSE